MAHKGKLPTRTELLTSEVPDGSPAASTKNTRVILPADGKPRLFDRSIVNTAQEAVDFITNILESSTEYSVIGKDLEGKILLWNEGARRLYGYEPGEVIGKANSSILHTLEDVSTGVPQQIMRVALDQGKWEGTLTRRRKTGDIFPARVVITPRRDASGKMIGFLLISKDISDEIRLTQYARSLIEASLDPLVTISPEGKITDVNEATIKVTGVPREKLIGTDFANYFTEPEKAREGYRRVNSELVVANKELEAFSYSVSHDLRAPLRHIAGFANIVLDDYSGQLEPEAQSYLRRVIAGTRQMGDLVDDLLKLSHLGRQELTRGNRDLQGLAQAVVSDFRAEAEAAGRQIYWRIGELPTIACDAGLMKQVFSNLLANAVKFTRKREQAIVEVGSTMKNGRMAIFVRDNGVGFSMKHADKLFGVFQRLHRVEDFEGTGIGLATVQRIIHKHGGQIWVEAEPDQGATFYFTVGTSPEAEAENLTARGA